MKPSQGTEKQDLRDIFKPEQAMQFVDKAMCAERDEPEPFIRMLLLLHDGSKDAPMQDALMALITAAYDCSIPHSQALDDYLDGIRAGRDLTDSSTITNPTDLKYSFGKHRVNLLPNKQQPASEHESEGALDSKPEATGGGEAGQPSAIDLLAELFTSASGAIRRGDKAELKMLKQACRLILENTEEDPEPPPQSRAPRDKNRERFLELSAAYGTRNYVWHELEKVLWAAERTDSETEFEHQMLADALALVIESEHTPVDLHNDLTDALTDLVMTTKAQDPLDPHILREWLPIALRRLQKKAEPQKEEGKDESRS